MSYSTVFLWKRVQVHIDRPLWTKHPKHDFLYEVNYGYIPWTVAPDKEEIDAYVLGVFEPLKDFEGICIAIIHRTNDDDDKCIIVPDGVDYSNNEIRKMTHFQERFFDSEILRFV